MTGEGKKGEEGQALNVCSREQERRQGYRLPHRSENGGRGEEGEYTPAIYWGAKEGGGGDRGNFPSHSLYYLKRKKKKKKKKKVKVAAGVSEYKKREKGKRKAPSSPSQTKRERRKRASFLLSSGDLKGGKRDVVS